MNSLERPSGTERSARLLRVLIIEDNPEDADTFTRYLTQDSGGTARVCETLPLGETALKRLRDDPPDCVLLDYDLPDMSGLDWLTEAQPNCPVVMLTGLGNESVAVAAIRAGAQDYLVKGNLSADALRRAIDGAVERHRLTRRLARANARTALVLDSVSDAYVALDDAFRFQYLNAAARRLIRQGQRELLGQQLWDVLPWLSGHEVGALLVQAQTSAVPTQFEAHVVQNSRVGGWYEVRTYPSEGGMTLYFKDISQHKEAEARRLRSSERLERLHRAGVALNAAHGLDEVSAAVAAQAAAVFGAVGASLALLSDAEPVLHIRGTNGLTEAEILAWPQVPLAAPFPLCEAVRSGELILLRTVEEATLWYPRLFDEGAGRGHAAWAAVPILRGKEGAGREPASGGEGLLPGDQVLGSLGLIFGAPQTFEADDRTLMLAYAELCAQALGRAQLYEAERELRHTLERRVEARTAELKQSNAELEQFAAVASHDLREPLRTVSSYVQLLSARYGGQFDERGTRYLDFILSGTSRMHRLIEDLLALSRLGTHGSAFSLTDTQTLLGTTLETLQTAVQECGAQITGQGLPQVMADATQLGQLFQNLITNAIKFRRPEVTPRLTITAISDGTDWHFTFSDNGIGIAPEYREQVFVLFQRLHRRDEYPGNGIGLSVCQKIVVRHGGRIGLDSVPGQGSTFWFTLPVHGRMLPGGASHD